MCVTVHGDHNGGRGRGHVDGDARGGGATASVRRRPESILHPRTIAEASWKAGSIEVARCTLREMPGPGCGKEDCGDLPQADRLLTEGEAPRSMSAISRRRLRSSCTPPRRHGRRSELVVVHAAERVSKRMCNGRRICSSCSVAAVDVSANRAAYSCAREAAVLGRPGFDISRVNAASSASRSIRCSNQWALRQATINETIAASIESSRMR